MNLIRILTAVTRKIDETVETDKGRNPLRQKHQRNWPNATLQLKCVYESFILLWGLVAPCH